MVYSLLADDHCNILIRFILYFVRFQNFHLALKIQNRKYHLYTKTLKKKY